jgi:hypothetical protein
MSEVGKRIADNLAQVRGRMAAAAERGGRRSDAVTLVAITKSTPVDVAAALVEAGCTRLGESRPQELWTKAAALANPAILWHLVGHLQRNKIRRTLPLLALIQSVDSPRLLAALDAEAAALGRPLDVLLEVNIALAITKTGLEPDKLEPLLEKVADFGHISVRGLMGMASLADGQGAARRDFARLRELRDRLAKKFDPQLPLAELSMGMSGDFEVAIEEGATLVRVGSALFEGIDL